MKVSLKKTVPISVGSSIEVPLEVTVSGNLSTEHGWIINYRDIKDIVLTSISDKELRDSDSIELLKAI